MICRSDILYQKVLITSFYLFTGDRHTDETKPHTDHVTWVLYKMYTHHQKLGSDPEVIQWPFVNFINKTMICFLLFISSFLCSWRWCIKIISHYQKIGYNINVLQQTACLVVNPITVGNFTFLFNCMLVGRTSDSMMVWTYLLMRW